MCVNVLINLPNWTELGGAWDVAKQLQELVFLEKEIRNND